ncbi:hypothetical protein PLEOSDRAFT_163717 [Pleurotus ostreatus PC15]|uniref:N-acetyltransferase domain-containing protein n=1 Tax=Pleurotus ostreatus (strain PC15) TaxID=1137138 RepID=A0A067NFH8_PLEO1|nr:hypothetical protein PLEOSDRAFT_163717 [Pleurotus ostreatus PC15]
MSALSFHIRPATVEDVDTLLILVRELLRQNLFASHPIGHVLLVVSDKPGDEGTMIGYMAYYFTFSTWTGKPGLALLDLFIREGYRGQGIGRAVFGELGKIAREMNCGTITWVAKQWNTPAVAFYKKMGAEEVMGHIQLKIDGNGIRGL